MAQPHPDCGWIYQCDDIVVEPRAHRLVRAGKAVSVEPKAYAVLVVLLQQAGEVVGKDVLLDTAWGHRHVTPGVLTRVISQLRHSLGDCAGNPRYIATVHSLGYRFIGDVQRIAAPSASDDPASSIGADNDSVHAPETPSDQRHATPPLHWLAAAITLAAIVAMLAAASLWHPPRGHATAPRMSPQPAFVVLPFAHNTNPHAPHPRHWPRNRRVATLYPAAQDHLSTRINATGYLMPRPEQAPAALE